MPDARGRAGVAPVAGLGLAAAALSSVASAKPWFRLATERPATPRVPGAETSADMPLALALSLVVLAGWGAVLVSRGAVRRACVAVALVAALGVLACAAAAPFELPDDLRTGLGSSSAAAPVDPTGWFLAAVVAAVLSVTALMVAWRAAPTWPTMSSRYDAPGTAVPEVRSDTDLWKALDEGHDPTDPAGPPSP